MLEGAAMRKGWFIIENVQDGDRTLEQQVEALRPAIAECAGKTVLDIGCAEALVTREFILGGAVRAFGVDAVPDHLEVARGICKGLPVEFALAKLGTDPMPGSPFGDKTYDIVLALGVAHKLPLPEVGITIAAQLSRDLVLLRSGTRQEGGIIHNKYRPHITCDAHAIMRSNGFELEQVVAGPSPFHESVEYWRKQ